MVETVYESEQILEWLSEVPDPEIPVLTITDLGIVRDVDCSDGVTVSLTPTYSGCPATEAIEASVVAALEDRGVSDVRIKRVLSPAWTTDWMAQKIDSVPPALTVTSDWASTSTPCRRLALALICSSSRGRPAIGAYWLWPLCR